jgi:hypothetical protein
VWHGYKRFGSGDDSLRAPTPPRSMRRKAGAADIVNKVLAGDAISSETAEEIIERLAIPLIENLQLVEITFTKCGLWSVLSPAIGIGANTALFQLGRYCFAAEASGDTA